MSSRVSSSSSGGSAHSSPHSIIPPIIKNDRDRQFLIQLNNWMDEEMKTENAKNLEHKFNVHKTALSKITDHVTSYKPLLDAINAEYQSCIQTILAGQQEALYMSGKLKAITCEPATLHNYRKRQDQLQERVSEITEENDALKAQIEEIRKQREARKKSAENKVAAALEERNKEPEIRIIPGLSIDESTDIPTLTRTLEKVKKQVKELKHSKQYRYSPHDSQVKLKDQLQYKMTVQDRLKQTSQVMQIKRNQLKVAVSAAKAWMKLQPPNQPIGEAVVMAMVRASRQSTMEREPSDMPGGSGPSEDDDPSNEHEAEQILEYIERFNELLDEEKYELAALHAANSPRGVLCTIETLYRFKAISKRLSLRPSPLLAFSEAVINTLPAHGIKPSDLMSREFVACALKEKRPDLITHWISKDRLTLSCELADLLIGQWEKKKGSTELLSLAQHIYTKLSRHEQAMQCMIKQGRLEQAISLAKKQDSKKQWDYISLLRDTPSAQLACRLHKEKLLSLGKIFQTLLESDAHMLIPDIVNTYQETEPDSLQKAIDDDRPDGLQHWRTLVEILQSQGFENSGLDMLALITVQDAMATAKQTKKS